MALSLKIAQFNKQQEKLQASLAKISAPRPAPAPTPAKAAVSGKAPAPAPAQNTVPFAQKFSFATEKQKLQQVASIRRAPVGAQIKRVLDLLRETRQSLLPSEINDLCFVDLTASKELSESLKHNVKVSFDGERFAYRSKHDVKNKAELLVLIRKVVEGIPMGELKDSYPGVIADVQAMKDNGDAWLVMNSDTREDVVYPNDPRIKIKVDEDVKQLVRSIEMPLEFIDIEKELIKAGLKPANNAARREARKSVPQTKRTQTMKKKRASKRIKYRNAHLPELLQTLFGECMKLFSYLHQ